MNFKIYPSIGIARMGNGPATKEDVVFSPEVPWANLYETGEEYHTADGALKKQAQPLFRYRTNDIIKIEYIKRDKFKKIIELYFNILGRSDQMLIIKGVNFFPESIGEIIFNEFPLHPENSSNNSCSIPK